MSECCLRDQTWAGADEGDTASPSQAEQVLGGRSPKLPRPFVLRSHRRGKFQFVLNVGTKTALSWSGGSSEACRATRACKTRADPIQPAGDRNDGKTAMGMRPWGFSFSGTCQGHSRGKQSQSSNGAHQPGPASRLSANPLITTGHCGPSSCQSKPHRGLLLRASGLPRWERQMCTQ